MVKADPICYTIDCLGMTGFDGEGWPWTASRVCFSSRKSGSKTLSANSNVAYNALPLAA